MISGNSKIPTFRYIYLLQSDGIGSLFIQISQLLNYADDSDCTLLVDFRKISFFFDKEMSFEYSEFKKFFNFSSERIIYNSETIDKILHEQADHVVGVLFSEENYFPAPWNLPIIPISQIISNSKRRYSRCYLKGKLSLLSEYKDRFHQYQLVVSDCIGVHARFGNGEYESNIRNQHALQRMRVSRESFFEAMENCQNKLFFVCTDTPSFLQQCIDKYGRSIVYTDRFMPPEGCGPGHNIWSVRNDCIGKEYLETRSFIGSYQLFGEALTEMFLLGECRSLICNESSFSHYARECCGVEAVLLN